MKQCKKCKENKSHDEFYDHPETKDGKDGSCKACISEYQREYHKRQRIKAIIALGGECAKCGIDDYRLLHIDHIEGFGNEHRRQRGTNRIILDILVGKTSNLQLLCANCHALKTWHE